MRNNEKQTPELMHDDYEMNDRESVWIVIGSISVYIKRTDEGVSVDLYPRGKEDESSVVSCWETFSECSFDEE